MNKENKQKMSQKQKTITLWVIFGVLVIITVIGFVFSKQIFGWSEVVDDGMGGTVTIWHGFFREQRNDDPTVQWLLSNLTPNLVKTVQIITIAIALAILIHYAAKLTFHSQKGKTISRLLVNFLKWIIAIATIFFILDAWGAPATAMLASAGVVTLIIGLGSQALVADILAGVFIVFEGDFQVGDIIIIDGWRGEVQSIGIRTTKLIDAGGNVKIVNNNEIKTIINQTKELSLAKCYVSIGYEARIENVEAIISDNLEHIKENIPAIVEGPYYMGVSELAESSVDLLFVAKCKENDIYQVQRDLNRQIKILFDDNNINIPFNQVVVHMGEDDKPKEVVSKKTQKKAEEFTEEQKEFTKDIDIKQGN